MARNTHALHQATTTQAAFAAMDPTPQLTGTQASMRVCVCVLKVRLTRRWPGKRKTPGGDVVIPPANSKPAQDPEAGKKEEASAVDASGMDIETALKFYYSACGMRPWVALSVANVWCAQTISSLTARCASGSLTKTVRDACPCVKRAITISC